MLQMALIPPPHVNKSMIDVSAPGTAGSDFAAGNGYKD